MGHADLPKIKKWWKMRAIPASRSIVQNIVKSAECINSEMYLAKNLALSVTDAYWVCPESVTLKYDQVKFTNLSMYSNGKEIDLELVRSIMPLLMITMHLLVAKWKNIGILSSRCQIL